MAEERKTLDQRAQMTDLERLRHSASHVLATAILKIWPEAQFAAGPPVDNGFYYDADLSHRISPDDFEKIEAEMKKEIKANHPFERMEVSRDEALALGNEGRLAALGERPEPSKFKLDIIENIPADEKISLYRSGDFIDLCAGPHVMRTGNIGAFKLTTVASAYYKGDAKNPQLQRVYGTAFKNKTELEAYFKMVEEAKRRDHRKIGAEMGLFAIDTEYVGPGMPLWLPKGTALVEELEKLAKETEFAAGYVRVKTPHLAREKMYTTSGHLPYYAESMFPAIELDVLKDKPEEREKREALGEEVESLRNAVHGAAYDFQDESEELKELITDADSKNEGGEESFFEGLERLWLNRELPLTLASLVGEFVEKEGRWLAMQPEHYYLKAMNCPHHHRIFAAEPHSYRDLPLRLAEYGTCYRYEQSGELFGLMRVRSLNMNDAHIYCTPEQFAQEFNAVNELYLKYFKVFGIEKSVMSKCPTRPLSTVRKSMSRSGV